MSDVAANKNGAVVVVGLAGTVLYSKDDAATFHMATAPTTNDLEAVAASDTGRFVIAGNDDYAYVSDDGGKTWTAGQVIDSSGTVLITGLASAGGNSFLAVGTVFGTGQTFAQNHVYLSADGGTSWSPIYTGPQLSVGGSLTKGLESVATDGAEHYVTVGMQAQAFYASGNPPASWTASSGFAQGSLLGGAAWDANDHEFIVAGFTLNSSQQLVGGAYVSGDDGKTFSQVCSAAGQASATGVAVGGGRFVVAATNVALSSSDGGAHCTSATYGSGLLGTAVAYVP